MLIRRDHSIDNKHKTAMATIVNFVVPTVIVPAVVVPTVVVPTVAMPTITVPIKAFVLPTEVYYFKHGGHCCTYQGTDYYTQCICSDLEPFNTCIYIGITHSVGTHVVLKMGGG